jgi:DNA mismatch repair protein MutL
MSKIRILSEEVFNKIAAGEVVERPASVVKELVENAIDAGARSIKINVERAGAKLISVTDDGSGMDADDALLCLEPHATSKISTAADIFSVRSLGFRGEAIPSIASVSAFTVRTRPHGSPEGCETVSRGGKVLSSKPAGCAPGTEMIVRDLFFNTPARKKFLKTPATEEKHIQETVTLLALPWPGISFELTMDGQKVFFSPGGKDVRPRIRTLLGRETEENLIPVDHKTERGFEISGLTAKHGFTRGSRREQKIFVNGRAVESLPVYRGIRDAYGGLADKGRFPPAVLFIKVDPSVVDVNVHPAKRELRFSDDNAAEEAVREAVLSALKMFMSPGAGMPSRLTIGSILSAASVSYTPKSAGPSFEQKPLFTGPSEETVRTAPQERPSSGPPPPPSPEPGPPPGSGSGKDSAAPEISRDYSAAPETASRPAPDESNRREDIAVCRTRPPETRFQGAEPELPGSGPVRVMGFLSDTYIVASSAAGLLLIDQHAAHERVLYERILKNTGSAAASQRLLFPITVELSRAETAFLLKSSKIFESLGFEVEPLSGNSVLLNAAPAAMGQNNAGGLLKDILEELQEKNAAQGKVSGSDIAAAACAAAVKANAPLTIEEARGLIRQMARCDMPYICPHGRPTVINLSLKELEKRFGRK